MPGPESTTTANVSTTSAALGGVSSFIGGFGQANFAANEVTALAHGNVKQAAVGAVEHYALNSDTWSGLAKGLTSLASKVENMGNSLGDAVGGTAESLAEDATSVAKLTDAVAPVSSALEVIGKAMPVVAGVMMAYQDGKEVYQDIKAGQYKKAVVAGVAGAVEVGFTTAGGPAGALIGAAAREAIVEGVALAGGPKANDAAMVTMVKQGVQLAEKGVSAGSKFVAGLNAPKPAAAPAKPASPAAAHPAAATPPKSASPAAPSHPETATPAKAATVPPKTVKPAASAPRM